MSPCFYGVDTPSRAELIARDPHDWKRSASIVGADTLGVPESRRACVPRSANDQRSYCTSCYTGVYPVAFPRNEQAYLQLALKSID